MEGTKTGSLEEKGLGILWTQKQTQEHRRAMIGGSCTQSVTSRCFVRFAVEHKSKSTSRIIEVSSILMGVEGREGKRTRRGEGGYKDSEIYKTKEETNKDARGLESAK